MRNNLRQSRMSKGYTQLQFATMLGITARQYQRIESGTQDGSIKLWVKIKSLLEKPIDYLVEQDT